VRTMNKMLLIFRHEFLRTIRRAGFIILTLALPVVGLLGIGVYRIAAGIKQPPAAETRIGYVDQVGGFNQFTTRGNIVLVPFDTVEAARQALVNKDITEYLVIPPNFISTGIVELYTTQQQLAPPPAITAAITNFISDNLLAGKVQADVITRVETPLTVVTTTLTSTGAVSPQQGGYARVIVPGIFGFLLALSLVFSSTYVLQSLGEEKENRLMEVLLSSVSTRQLLAGKVLGLGAAGLMQVIVWVISLPLLLKFASSSFGGLISTLHVPAAFWVLGVVYFILGYLMFAVLSAGIAAITSTVQEAQGIAGLYTLFNIAPFWLFSLLLLYPSSPVWIVFSIFPFSAPVLTMLRLGMVGVPVWQLVVSIGVLALSITGGLMLAGKLLRIYLLMYGKRPTLGAIIRSLRSR
jgi:ABC-2 type transport system permease protein